MERNNKLSWKSGGVIPQNTEICYEHIVNENVELKRQLKKYSQSSSAS